VHGRPGRRGTATQRDMKPRRQYRIFGWLDGTKPEPRCILTSCELMINLQTAKALGVAVPPSLLDRARQGDRIIAPYLFAQSGHDVMHCKCLLLGVKRASHGGPPLVATKSEIL
jgi:hypothetical protein